MKIVFLMCLSGPDSVYNVGDVAEVEAAEALRLIDAGIAAAVAMPPAATRESAAGAARETRG